MPASQTSSWSLEFIPADLASWLWPALAAIVVLEAIRYVRRSRRPTRGALRGLIAVAVSAVVVLLAVGRGLGWIEVGHLPVLVGLGAVMAVWTLRSYQRTTRPIPPRVRQMLIGLRLAAIAVALVMLAGPVLERSRIEREPSVLGIMLDTSKSMSVRDVVVGGQVGNEASIPRIVACERLLASNRAAFQRLAEHMEIRWLPFDVQVRAEKSPTFTAEGPLSAVVAGLPQARAALSRSSTPVTGIILLSDGRDTAGGDLKPEEAADELARAGIPLYAVGLGSDLPVGQTRMLQARRMDAPDRVSVLNKLSVEAEFLAIGLDGVPIEVLLEYDGKIVDRQAGTPAQTRQALRMTLAHVPDKPGLHRIVVVGRWPSNEGEGTKEARLSGFVRVVDDTTHVLYKDRGRYERAAIARSLELAREFTLTKLDLNRPSGSPPDPLMPATQEQWGVYEVVLIGDVEASQFPADSMAALAQSSLTRGQAVCLLGGIRTIGSGRYKGSPLDAVLPIDLGVIGQIPPPVPARLTPAGKAHPICLLADDPAASERLWAKLPPFAGASRLVGLSATAEVLVESLAGEPLLVVQEQGQGRVAALAVDSTWQWSFAADEGVAAQRRFWRQLVLWLANRRPEVWVAIDKPQYDLTRLKAGEQVAVKAGMFDPNTGQPPARVRLKGLLVGPDGKSQAVTFSPKGEGFAAVISGAAVPASGQYEVRVEASAGNQPTVHSAAAFLVDQVDQEMVNPLADLENLRRLANRTVRLGGGYYEPAQFGKLLEEIAATGQELSVRRVDRLSLLDRQPWLWLAAIVALVGTEWIIRRRKGLV